jgi:hypothetical protein
MKLTWPSTKRGAIAGLAVAVLLILWAFGGAKRGAERSDAPAAARAGSSSSSPRRRPGALPSLPSSSSSSTTEPAPQASATRALEYASDGIPYMPPGPDDPHPETFVHPHPITPRHIQIFTENALLYQLNEAVDGREAPRLRRFLQQYRAEFPEDPHDMQAGYALIADCLENPGDERLRVAAQRYVDAEIASTLRRFVRRHCLEKPGSRPD